METVTLPNDLEAEAAILSAILLDNQAYEIVAEMMLTSSDFYRRSHRVIWEAMSELSRGGEKIDLVMLHSVLSQAGTLESAGGQAYLADMAVKAVTSANVSSHVRLVQDLARRRDAVRRCSEVLNQIHTLSLAEIQAKLFFEYEDRTLKHRNIQSLAPEVLRHLEARYQAEKDSGEVNLSGLSTGISRLDHLMDGFQPGDLIILGADTGQGKSALAAQIATHIGQTEHVHIMNLEMSAEQSILRQVAARSTQTLTQLRKNLISDWPSVLDAVGKLSRLYITFDDSSTSLSDVRASITRAAKNGAKLIIVDYLQLVENKGASTEERAVGEVATALKQAAKRYRLPILAIASLNRVLASRTNKRPRRSDLRGSGQIEYDADVIMLLYRESEYREERGPVQAPGKDNTELVIAKGRNLGESVIPLMFEGKKMRFVEEEPF